MCTERRIVTFGLIYI